MTKKISQLPAATSVDTNDEFVINQDGTTKKLTTANQWDFANVNIDGGTIDGTAVNATTLMASGNVNFDSGTLFVDASENKVGIGTTSSVSKVAIYDTNNTAASSSTFWEFDFSGLEISNQSTTANTVSGIAFSGGTSRNSVSGIGNILESTSLGALGFFTGGSGRSSSVPERMRITSSGNVGIGTTAPSSELDVAGTIKAQVFATGDGGFVVPQLLRENQSTTRSYKAEFTFATSNNLTAVQILFACGQTAGRGGFAVVNVGGLGTLSSHRFLNVVFQNTSSGVTIDDISLINGGVKIEYTIPGTGSLTGNRASASVTGVSAHTLTVTNTDIT
jgi:hypothetical protein